MRTTPDPRDRPNVTQLALVDWVFLAIALGCVISIVFAPERLQLLKTALAFWGACCVALVAVNVALRAAFEALATRRRVRHLEEKIEDMERDLVRLSRNEDVDKRNGR